MAAFTTQKKICLLKTHLSISMRLVLLNDEIEYNSYQINMREDLFDGN